MTNRRVVPLVRTAVVIPSWVPQGATHYSGRIEAPHDWFLVEIDVTYRLERYGWDWCWVPYHGPRSVEGMIPLKVR